MRPALGKGSGVGTRLDRDQPILLVARKEMAGNKFLNPILKIVICLIGMLVMGYFLYPSVKSGIIEDNLTVLRALVFLGFTYLMVQSIKQIIERREQ
jgi:hypothetical protein